MSKRRSWTTVVTGSGAITSYDLLLTLFPFVPLSGSSDSEDHDLDLLDDDTKAEIRAYGKLFRHRKTREGVRASPAL